MICSEWIHIMSWQGFKISSVVRQLKTLNWTQPTDQWEKIRRKKNIQAEIQAAAAALCCILMQKTLECKPVILPSSCSLTWTAVIKGWDSTTDLSVFQILSSCCCLFVFFCEKKPESAAEGCCYRSWRDGETEDIKKKVFRKGEESEGRENSSTETKMLQKKWKFKWKLKMTTTCCVIITEPSITISRQSNLFKRWWMLIGCLHTIWSLASQNCTPSPECECPVCCVVAQST